MGNNIKYMSGPGQPWSVATPIGGLRHESPLLPFNNQVLVFHQDFVQLNANFVAQDYNTPHPTLVPTAYLIDESPREDYKGNCVKWTRSWARVPATYDAPGGNFQFTIPVFGNRVPGVVISLDLTVRRTFYLCGNFGTFTQWQNIPVNQGLRVLDTDGTVLGAIGSGIDLDSSTNPSDAQYRALIGTQIQIEDSKITPWRGSIFVRDDYLITAI